MRVLAATNAALIHPKKAVRTLVFSPRTQRACALPSFTYILNGLPLTPNEHLNRNVSLTAWDQDRVDARTRGFTYPFCSYAHTHKTYMTLAFILQDSL